MSLFFNRGLYWSLNLDNEIQNQIIHNVYYGDTNYKMYLVDHKVHEGVYNEKYIDDMYKYEEGKVKDVENEYGDILEIRVLGSLNRKSGKKSREEHIIKLHTIVDGNFCVGSEFTCSCKDFLYRSKVCNIVCKHITFVLCKIAGIYDKEYFKTKLLTSYQTEYIFNLMKNERLWRNTNVSVKYLNDNFKNKKEIEEDEMCNICLESLNSESEKSDILSCPECLNIVHEKCMNVWLDINRSCVFCRSDQWINYDKDTLNCKIIKNEI